VKKPFLYLLCNLFTSSVVASASCSIQPIEINPLVGTRTYSDLSVASLLDNPLPEFLDTTLDKMKKRTGDSQIKACLCMADTYYFRGSRKDKKRAIELYADLSEQKEDSDVRITAQNRIGHHFIRMQDYEKAREWFFLSAITGNLEGTFFLAKCNAAQHKFSDSVILYQSIAERQEDTYFTARAECHLGLLFQKFRNIEDAIKWLSEASHHRQWVACLALGDILEKEKRTSEALYYYEFAAQQMEDLYCRVQAERKLAKNLLIKGEKEKVALLYKDILKYAESNYRKIKIMMKMAHLYSDYFKKIKWYQRVAEIALSPSSFYYTAQFELYQIYIKTGQKTEVLHCLKKLASYNANNPYYVSAIEALKRIKP
jgi:tetratricopeptide (TPR) repeat protein